MAELFKVDQTARKFLFEGVQGENEARSIQFDITPWTTELGNGAVTATAKRPTDAAPYPVTVTRDGNTVTWKPTSTDTAIDGTGMFQLEYTVDDVLAKTCIWSTMVAPSLDPAGDPPDPYDNWLAEMREIEASAIQAAQDADGSADDAAASAASIAGDHDELINIRIGADGTTYANAGDAVRGQVSGLKSTLTKGLDGADKGIIPYLNFVWELGSMQGGADVYSTTQYRTKGYYPTSAVDYVECSNSAYAGTVYYYTDNAGTYANAYTQFNSTAGLKQAINKTYPYYRILYVKSDYSALPNLDNIRVYRIAEYQESINDLLTIAEYKYGKNRFDINAPQVAGYLGSDGQLVQSGNWHTVDYCYVEGFENVYCSSVNNGTRSATTLFFLCTYDANKNFIEKVADMPSYPLTLGENVAYIRWSFNGVATAENLVMLEKGNAFTSYEQFSKELILITDKTLTSEEEPANAKAVGDIKTVVDGLAIEVDKVKDATVVETTNRTQITLNPIQRRYIISNGTVGEFNNSSWQVSDPVDITSYDSLIVTAGSGYSNLLYAFYNESDTFISGLGSPSNAAHEISDEEVAIPDVAKYIRVAKNGNTSMALTGVTNAYKNSANVKWSGMKWTVVGDSLTAVNTRTTKHYFDYVSEETGISVVNMGDSGSGYRAEADLGTAFYQRISSVPTDSDVVTIFGSFNDGISNLGTATDTGTSTLGGCINTTIDNLYAIMPTVQLGIVSPTPWVGANPYNQSGANGYADLLEAICKRRSIPFLNLYYESNLRPWDATFRQLAYSKDEGNGVHPDETGHKIIASRFMAFLESLLI